MTARFDAEHIAHRAATAWRESSGSSTLTRYLRCAPTSNMCLAEAKAPRRRW